jgi:hypothetical protein
MLVMHHGVCGIDVQGGNFAPGELLRLCRVVGAVNLAGSFASISLLGPLHNFFTDFCLRRRQATMITIALL